jgi:hypothetical protein
VCIRRLWPGLVVDELLPRSQMKSLSKSEFGEARACEGRVTQRRTTDCRLAAPKQFCFSSTNCNTHGGLLANLASTCTYVRVTSFFIEIRTGRGMQRAVDNLLGTRRDSCPTVCGRRAAGGLRLRGSPFLWLRRLSSRLQPLQQRHDYHRGHRH